MGVEAARHEHQLGTVPLERRQRLPREPGEVRLGPGAGREGDVERRAGAGAAASLVLARRSRARAAL